MKQRSNQLGAFPANLIVLPLVPIPLSRLAQQLPPPSLSHSEAAPPVTQENKGKVVKNRLGWKDAGGSQCHSLLRD